MKVSVFGAARVGLVTAACLAGVGNSLACLEVDPARVRGPREDRMPIHEPGLAEHLAAGRAAALWLEDRVEAAQVLAA